MVHYRNWLTGNTPQAYPATRCYSTVPLERHTPPRLHHSSNAHQARPHLKASALGASRHRTPFPWGSVRSLPTSSQALTQLPPPQRGLARLPCQLRKSWPSPCFILLYSTLSILTERVHVCPLPRPRHRA